LERVLQNLQKFLFGQNDDPNSVFASLINEFKTFFDFNRIRPKLAFFIFFANNFAVADFIDIIFWFCHEVVDSY
jgi:hypothetical protein